MSRLPRTPVILAAIGLAACGAGTGAIDARPPSDAGAGDGAALDAPGLDAGLVDARLADAGAADAPDDAPPLDAPPPDASPSPDAPPPDAAPPPDGPGWVSAVHVDVYIDNFCNVTVVPPDLTVPAGEVAEIDWHNNSVDYDADLWASYGGGYLELATGAIWNETFTWCAGAYPYTGEMDIGPAGVPDSVCAHHAFQIHCP